MATVWIAEDPLLSRRVAVKLLLPQLAVDEALRLRFRNEAIAAAKLTHPGIVATYDTGDDDGTAYIVMELVEGTTLRRLIDERGRLPVPEAAGIASQVADALEHAHRQGLVHRDIKPANVLVQPDGRVKVTDFGIAKAAGGDDLTRTGTVVGTARYLAPEQVNGNKVDGRADVYALGLILYEMLAGSAPFAGDSDMATAVARLTNAPEPIRMARPEVSRHLEDVVARGLARDPEYRYQSAQAFKDALTPGHDTAPTGALAPPPAPRPAAAPPHAQRSRRVDRSRCAASGTAGSRGYGPTRAPLAVAGADPGPPRRRRHGRVRPHEPRRRLRRPQHRGGRHSGAADRRRPRLRSSPRRRRRAPRRRALRHRRRSRHRLADGELQQPQLRQRQVGRRPVGPARRRPRRHRGHGDHPGGRLERRDLRGRSAGQLAPSMGPGPRVGDTLPAVHRFDLNTRGQYVLVWCTQLPQSDKLQIGDVKVEGR